MMRANATDMSLLHAIQKREDKEKADAWWMDDGTRTFLFKCMQLESSAVLTVDRDNHEHMTCRQVRDTATLPGMCSGGRVIGRQGPPGPSFAADADASIMQTLNVSCALQLAELPPARVGEYWRRYMSAFAGAPDAQECLPCITFCSVRRQRDALASSKPLQLTSSAINPVSVGCAECLVQWRGDPDSAAGRRLDRLYFEALQMWTAVQVGYPDRVKVGTDVRQWGEERIRSLAVLQPQDWEKLTCVLHVAGPSAGPALSQSGAYSGFTPAAPLHGVQVGRHCAVPGTTLSSVLTPADRRS